MNTLWSFSLEFKQLENEIADIEEDRELSLCDREKELQEHITGWFELGILDNYSKKFEDLAGYINYQEYLAGVRKAEIARLQALVDQAENRASQLRKCLAEQMSRASLKRIENERVVISLRGKSVIIR